MAPSSVSVGESLRGTAQIGQLNNEESMYPGISRVLESLLPSSNPAIVRVRGTGTDKPDMSITSRGGAPIAHIEVKKADTLSDAFRVDPTTGKHQIGRYREEGLPVLLSDAVRWYDVTSSDDVRRPVCDFSADDPSTDRASEARLRSLLNRICGVRPRYGVESAVSAISGVIAQINSADDEPLDRGWKIVRSGLALTIDNDSLDGVGVGELVAFTLLSIAASLGDLPDADFVEAASAEWRGESAGWDASELPIALGATLLLFRDEDRRLSGSLLGTEGWVSLRSIAAWVNASHSGDRWARLSNLWDEYLRSAGRRKTLGSWQTHRAIADFQAAQVADALRNLGYIGLHDNDVTIIDPCCGTGVYLTSVIDKAVHDGSSPGAFNAPERGPRYPRLLGADISSTAVAAAHIRVSVTGTKPALYMTDTLATGASSSLLSLFDTTHGGGANPIVAAARADYEEMQLWASREGVQRDPVLAVIGNPPYLRAGLSPERYRDMGWWTDVLDRWRTGSGGQGGGVLDLFAAFWAWAIMLCSQRNEKLPTRFATTDGPVGVISFITNRILIDGRTFGSMRSAMLDLRPRIDITDFGPGSRGGGAGRWSEQPFPIETGTSIVTLQLGTGMRSAEVWYRKARWVDSQVEAEDAILIQPRVDLVTRGGASYLFSGPWVPQSSEAILAEVVTVNGIVTGADHEWVAVESDRRFSLRHAYRPFDNRWIPGEPPQKARRGQPIAPGEAPASAWWREDTLFNPHLDLLRAGGWYLIAQFDRALPGPAFHASRELPNHHLFKGSQASKVVRVGPGIAVPPDYRQWADRYGLDGPSFWLYTLAAAHHSDYWITDTEMSLQLAEKRVAPLFSKDSSAVSRLVLLGSELVNLWNLETVIPVETSGGPGHWRFVNHDEADGITIHGRRALASWRQARDGEWNVRQAAEYARSVASILRVRSIGNEVSDLFA